MPPTEIYSTGLCVTVVCMLIWVTLELNTHGILLWKARRRQQISLFLALLFIAVQYIFKLYTNESLLSHTVGT